MRGGHDCVAHREGVCLPPHSVFILVSAPPRGHVARTEVVGLQPERRMLHNPSSASSTFPPGLLPQVWVPALGLRHDDAAGSRNRDKMEDEPPFGDPKAVDNHSGGQQVQSTGEDRRPHGGVQ